MNAQLTQKLAALGMALLMSGAMVGGIAYLFSGQVANAQTVTLATA